MAIQDATLPRGFVAEGGGNYKGLDRAPGYAGTYPEIETGLNYMGARYYYGAIGRFLSPDPAPLNPLHPVGLNRYAYGNDSPARYTDPNGRQAFSSFNVTQKQVNALAVMSNVSARRDTAQSAVASNVTRLMPRSSFVEGGLRFEGGTPLFGGGAQGSVTMLYASPTSLPAAQGTGIQDTN